MQTGHDGWAAAKLPLPPCPPPAPHPPATSGADEISRICRTLSSSGRVAAAAGGGGVQVRPAAACCAAVGKGAWHRKAWFECGGLRFNPAVARWICMSGGSCPPLPSPTSPAGAAAARRAAALAAGARVQPPAPRCAPAAGRIAGMLWFCGPLCLLCAGPPRWSLYLQARPECVAHKQLPALATKSLVPLPLRCLRALQERSKLSCPPTWRRPPSPSTMSPP